MASCYRPHCAARSASSKPESLERVDLHEQTGIVEDPAESVTERHRVTSAVDHTTDGLQNATNRYGGVSYSGPFLLVLETPSADGSGTTPVELGGDGGIMIMRTDWFRDRVAGKIDWTAKGKLTGITGDGQQMTVAWNGVTSSFDLALSS
jgi:hypothetical protein